jgi:hypothetical protein
MNLQKCKFTYSVLLTDDERNDLRSLNERKGIFIALLSQFYDSQDYATLQGIKINYNLISNFFHIFVPSLRSWQGCKKPKSWAK